MDKKVVILGGSSGIGKSCDHRFAEEGWQVLIVSPNASQGEEARYDLPGSGNHLFFEADVRVSRQLLQLREFVNHAFGSFDTLINSIGVSESHPVIETDFYTWDNALQIMLYGSVKTCRMLVPMLKEGGRIIHITSIHAERVAYGSSAYGMAKAAITQFSRSLAVELASRNILCNTIAPGFINTPMSVKSDGKNEIETEWFRENYIKNDHLPLKRVGSPEEVAGVAWFLSGPDASYITGSVLTVDGGLTITF